MRNTFYRLSILFFVIVIFCFKVGVVYSYNEFPNNKVGISLLQPSPEDIRAASDMVNGESGGYGYVTLVIQENDRDVKKWQQIFDELRIHKLIPIIRLSTIPEGENWKRPKKEDVDGWIQFLNSLNWVIRDRYIILFNEPNHATEWGGEVDPKSYGEIVVRFAEELHKKNSNYFVMMAGFDASAPSNPTQYEDEETYIKELLYNQKELFNNIDGWASHAYPNPGFSGSPNDRGRKSIRGYEWELELLHTLGITKKLPVFITETGWTDLRLSRETIASYYETAFNSVWLPDERVVAITPFVFDYQAEPFLGFSFKKKGENSFYPQYDSIKQIPKIIGKPFIIEKGTILQELPSEFVADSNYRFHITIKNTGQSIWDRGQGYKLAFGGADILPFEYYFSDIVDLAPFEESTASLFIKTHKTEGEHNITVELVKDDTILAQTQNWSFSIKPLPQMVFHATIFPKLMQNKDGFEIQIYDQSESLIYKKAGLRTEGGEGVINEVPNIVLGLPYRIVILKKYYLPRQEFIVFSGEKNTVLFDKMIPLDLNSNGEFTFSDLLEILKKPSLIELFLP